MSRLFDRSTGWIVDRPFAAWLLLACLSGLAMVGYYDPSLLTDLFTNSPENPAAERRGPRDSAVAVPDVDRISLSNSDAIVVVESDQFFTPDGAKMMRHVVETLKSQDYIRGVLWMDEAPPLNIFGLPQPLFPSSNASAKRFAAARKTALDHPLVGGQLLSDDGRTLLLLINFKWLFVTSDEDCTSGLRQIAEDASADYPHVDVSFRVTGRVPLYVTAIRSHELNQWRYQMVGYGMIFLMSVILFRGVTAVLIVSLAPALGVFWTLGMVRFFGFQNNPFNDVVLPVLISLVGLTDGVHLIVQIRRNRVAGHSPRESARMGIREVGLACGLTSLTTAIGFGSLALAHHEIVREFGWCCVLGVILTFVAVVTTIPLACSSFLGKRVHIGHDKGLIDRNLNRIGGLVDLVLARPTAFSLAGIGITLMLFLTSLTLRPDERNANSLPTHSEAAVALRQMDAALGGLEFGYVDVSWSDQIPADSSEVLDAIRTIDTILRDEPLIGRPLSIRNFLDALPGEGRAENRMSMLELLPPPLKRAFYTPERRTAQVSFRVQDLGIAKYGPVFENIEDKLAALKSTHPDFDFELTGSPVRRWRNLYQIVVDLAASLGTATLIIFVVLACVYRSIRIGLISVIPNMFPLAITGTYLVVTGQVLELVSVCAFTVCLGIAVDDTIHFLTRFEEERKKTDDDHEAIRRSFTGVGTALIMTTIILVSGFSTVLFSDSRDHRIFATMGGLTIGSALLGDLIFLPALLARFAKKKRKVTG
jgi:predicted RND superfamily exporter protein